MVGHGRDGEVPLPRMRREYVNVAILSVRALAVPAVLSLVHVRIPSSR